MIKVKYLKEWKEVNLDKGTVLEVLKKAEINPETVIVSKNGEIVSEDTEIKSGDELETVRIISGG